jgi:hypothetical protein
MTSFLSDKNINRLQYELRQIFPENKWTGIQSSVRDSARIWFSQHSETLQLIYQRDGLEGLNRKFISDMMASAEYFEHTNEPAYAQDQLFDTEISDPNIVADQPMPYVTGIENPMFTFSAFSKTYGAKGEPETQYIYREKPNYGPRNPMSHTLQGPGPRRGPIRHYSDYGPTDKSPYNITDRISQGFRDCETCPQPQPPPRTSNLRFRPQVSEPPKATNTLISVAKHFLKPFKSPFGTRQTREDASYQISGNYGPTMSENIYRTDQSKFFPNAYPGYKLGTMVDEYDSENGMYVPYPNNVTTNVTKTLNQLRFGDVPVVTEMSNAEIAQLGHQLYRQKDRPKRQRAPKVDGCGIPRQEFIELHDDYPTNQVRAKFHLDQIYNTPESRINTILDPVMGKTAMWQSQERSMLDIPCSSMDSVPAAFATDRYQRRKYVDGYSDSLSVPGCSSCNSEPRRQAYPTRDFVPTLYTTSYDQV